MHEAALVSVGANEVRATVGIDIRTQSSTCCEPTKCAQECVRRVIRNDLKMRRFRTETHKNCDEGLVGPVPTSSICANEYRPGIVDAGSEEWTCRSYASLRKVTHWRDSSPSGTCDALMQPVFYHSSSSRAIQYHSRTRPRVNYTPPRSVRR